MDKRLRQSQKKWRPSDFFGNISDSQAFYTLCHYAQNTPDQSRLIPSQVLKLHNVHNVHKCMAKYIVATNCKIKTCSEFFPCDGFSRFACIVIGNAIHRFAGTIRVPVANVGRAGLQGLCGHYSFGIDGEAASPRELR